MPSPQYHIVPGAAEAIQYTGSNSADIVSQIPDVEFVSEQSNVLTIDRLGTIVVLSVGHWVRWNQSAIEGLNNNQYTNEWGCFAPCETVEAVSVLESSVSALEAAVDAGAVRSCGVSAVPPLDPSQSATVPVALNPAMPSSQYAPYAAGLGGVNLGDLVITSVTVVDADTVAVEVENTGLDTVSGVSLLVHAIA